MRLLILFILTSSIFISSCTIQKRTFRNGYYVSWNKPIKEKKPKELNDETIVSEIRGKDSVQNVEEQLSELSHTDSIFSDLAETQKQADSLFVKKPEKMEMSTLSVVSILKKGLKIESVFSAKKQPKKEDNSEQKLDLFAANSLAFALFCGVMLVLSITASLPESLVFIGVLALFITIAFAIIAFIRKKRRPEKHKGTFLAIIALGILAMGVIFFLGFLILSI